MRNVCEYGILLTVSLLDFSGGKANEKSNHCIVVRVRDLYFDFYRFCISCEVIGDYMAGVFDCYADCRYGVLGSDYVDSVGVYSFKEGEVDEAAIRYHK